MNQFTRTLVLSAAALATIATTVQFASAGDRYWRKHHRGHWQRNAVIAGVAAGALVGGIVATRPRIVYREAPVVIEEEPVYWERETVYIDPDLDDDYRPAYRKRVPVDEEHSGDRYAKPPVHAYSDPQYSGGDQSQDDDYFPERPQLQSERRQSTRHDFALGDDLKPWTGEWRKYCAERYASFNPSNGTYLGYDQKRHFCKVG